MTDKLRECPFCGGNNVDVFNWEVTFQGDYFKAYCKDCDFELKPQRTEEEAIKAWNTRKPMVKLVDKLDQAAFSVPDEDEDEDLWVVDLHKAIDLVRGVQNE